MPGLNKYFSSSKWRRLSRYIVPYKSVKYGLLCFVLLLQRLLTRLDGSEASNLRLVHSSAIVVDWYSIVADFDYRVEDISNGIFCHLCSRELRHGQLWGFEIMTCVPEFVHIDHILLTESVPLLGFYQSHDITVTCEVKILFYDNRHRHVILLFYKTWDDIVTLLTNELESYQSLALLGCSTHQRVCIYLVSAAWISKYLFCWRDLIYWNVQFCSAIFEFPFLFPMWSNLEGRIHCRPHSLNHP